MPECFPPRDSRKPPPARPKGGRTALRWTGKRPSGGDEISYDDAPNLQRVKTGVFGVLELSLRSDSYAWKFVRAAGKDFTDSGTTDCH